MSFEQKNWDAALIKTWRTDATLFDAVKLFGALCGSKEIPLDSLLRTPRKGFPWDVRVRVFVASHLSKISNRLWGQDPSKDILLLRKLEASKYNTETDEIANNEYKYTQAKQHRDNARNKVMAEKIANRNSNTDWNTVKGR